MKFIDRSGIKYNRLTAISVNSKRSNGYYWNCKCECGKLVVAKGSSLTTGDVKSCGCWNMEALLSRITKHKEGKAGQLSKEYKAWENMKRRCLIETNPSYKNYGGRGIKVCDVWVNSYIEFLKEVGRAPGPQYSLDRINNNGNYEPGNCRWATRSEQSKNKRLKKDL